MLNQSERDESIKSIKISDKSVEEAIAAGLDQLGVTRDQVTVEIINEGKRGVFGLGSEDAEVRLTLIALEVPPADEQANETQLLNEETVADKVEAELLPDVDSDADLEDDSADLNVQEIAVEYLRGLLSGMGIKATVTARVATDLVEENEEPPLVLDITGPDLGILIGRRSETLRALQYMTRLMVSKRMNSWQPLVIDVESYRVRRRQSLHKLAETMAERAISTGRRVVMEAMPAYERRIIHMVLRDHPGVTTRSTGSDDNRKVTIIPK